MITLSAWLTRRQLGARRHGPQSWGYVEAGHLDEIRILEIIGRLGPGPHELICHPGEVADEGDTRGQSPRYQRTAELASLTSSGEGDGSRSDARRGGLPLGGPDSARGRFLRAPRATTPSPPPTSPPKRTWRSSPRVPSRWGWCSA